MTVPFSENGGFAATNFYMFVPVQTSDLGLVYIGIFDPTSFDDLVDSSFYAYRQEDIQVGRVPTVRRVILVYRDLGLANIIVTIQGVNDNDKAISTSVVKSIGTASASQRLLTKFVDITFTSFRPQLTVARAAGGGPISIISATMIGECEEVSL